MEDFENQRIDTVHLQTGPTVYIFEWDMFLPNDGELLWRVKDLPEVQGTAQGMGLETIWWDGSEEPVVNITPEEMKMRADRIREAGMAPPPKTPDESKEIKETRIIVRMPKKSGKLLMGEKGSAKSGNYGHVGRQGKLGGSAPKSTGGTGGAATQPTAPAQPAAQYYKDGRPKIDKPNLDKDANLVVGRDTLSAKIADPAPLVAAVKRSGFEVTKVSSYMSNGERHYDVSFHDPNKVSVAPVGNSVTRAKIAADQMPGASAPTPKTSAAKNASVEDRLAKITPTQAQVKVNASTNLPRGDGYFLRSPWQAGGDRALMKDSAAKLPDGNIQRSVEIGLVSPHFGGKTVYGAYGTLTREYSDKKLQTSTTDVMKEGNDLDALLKWGNDLIAGKMDDKIPAAKKVPPRKRSTKPMTSYYD